MYGITKFIELSKCQTVHGGWRMIWYGTGDRVLMLPIIRFAVQLVNAVNIMVADVFISKMRRARELSPEAMLRG
jgi:hypothetical protein